MNEKVISQTIVLPVVTANQAVEAFDKYQELASKIIKPEDVQYIQNKEFKKKSFWRKCMRFFNLNLQLVSEQRIENDKYFTYQFTYRAIAPNGAFCDGTGTCSSDEKGLMKTEHNTRAIAETRAKNRAIADLVAFGEVSAEEIVVDQNEIKQKKQPAKKTQIITEPQRKRLYAIYKTAELSENEYKQILGKWGYASSDDITKKDYENICREIEDFDKGSSDLTTPGWASRARR